jgi:hypothetical protein
MLRKYLDSAFSIMMGTTHLVEHLDSAFSIMMGTTHLAEHLDSAFSIMMGTTHLAEQDLFFHKVTYSRHDILSNIFQTKCTSLSTRNSENYTLKDLSFSQNRLQRLLSPQMWHRATWQIINNILENFTSSIFRIQTPSWSPWQDRQILQSILYREGIQHFSTLKMEDCDSCETSVTTY